MQIKSAKDLIVYQKAYDLAMQIFYTSKSFPKGGAIFIDRPDTPLVQICMLELARGVGETQIRGAFRE